MARKRRATRPIVLKRPSTDGNPAETRAPSVASIQTTPQSISEIKMTSRITNFLRDEIPKYIIGSILTLLAAAAVSQYDNGFLARLIGATPKWRSIDHNADKDFFDMNCEYRLMVSNLERDRDVPNVLEISRPTSFYPFAVNQDAIVFSYDTLTINVSYSNKSIARVAYRVHNNWKPTGDIGSRDWEILQIQRRCPR